MSNRNKYFLFGIIAVFTFVFCWIESAGNGDFLIFYSASNDIINGENVYTKNYFDGYHYYYSIAFGLCLKLFTLFPFTLAKFLWLFLNCYLYWHLYYLLSKQNFVKQLEAKKQFMFLFLCFIISFQFFRDNIHTSQITILILWCCINGLACIYGGKTLKGSCLIAIGINIKLMPIVFIPYLIYRGYFKACIYIILVCVVLLIVPSLFIGYAENIELLKTYWWLINPTKTNHVLDVDERSFHGLTTLLSTLLVEKVPDMYALPLKRNIADVSIDTLSKIILVVRLILVATTVYFLKLSTLFKKQTNTFNQFLEISYILLLIPLIFPHQQHYAFLFAIPATLIVFWQVYTKQITNKFIITGLIFSVLCFNLKFWLGAFNPYYEHYKVITYGALVLVPLLVYTNKLRNKI